ncbi:hypothetical protein IPZ58_28455 [Streptomyces roseoverticillatus]|uniref:hypothetical protein n=1 Tax=Streptomyces roseoverticillatus TaxID=66429 RepID=UPI001F1EC5AF|nr:hypothetical protein [Streptomyces roseoverticillatus]MCF3105494.1 hypothetical protein [Streptomyces roseoverticillatus]
MQTNEEAAVPAVGSMVLDTRRDRVGEVMQTTPSWVYLRAFGGGREWVTALGDVEPVGVVERLRARVAEVNAERRRQP